MEWEPCENGRLYNVLKLMEGYDRHAALRIDIFPVEHTQKIRRQLPYGDTRRRIAARGEGRDDNSETIIKSWDKYIGNLMKYPQFLANITAFSDSPDIAVMLVDSVAAEAVESGTYLVENLASPDGFNIYSEDVAPISARREPDNYVAPMLSLYTLEEIRPMFSFPILYPGESIECQKETDPVPFAKTVKIDRETGEIHEVITLGESELGYEVTFPVKLFKKHAFIAGVPGAGKTNTMLYLVTTLWRDTQQHVPFLVLEPAKQEYRALAMIDGMDALCVFSPGADTRFPLHINPFQFPVGLTLAEHIANLNSVFAGAFELIPPSPFLIDKCIERVYINHGWNINERNSGKKTYPTMQELYDSLKIAVEESGYEGESRANIRSVMEVRIGSLLRREIGNVYNVRESSIAPEDWLSCPVIIELESLGEGPANFMSLLISTLIREVLKIRKTSDLSVNDGVNRTPREVEHIIFYEEAHNLIGPNTDAPVGGSVDPKISATKYLVKMLAEVRALGEGIVIADQLPTAMAPEVLKNTGLKLGHRITAQDDRNLLGSTMSASADQLEEQGTFGTGYALIFYENLLKPFKMRVCEWEKGVSSVKYNSPTNLQLFEKLKENRVYLELLRRSSVIMRDKIRTEFDIVIDTAHRFNSSFNTREKSIIRLSEDIAVLSRELAGLSDRQTINDIRKQIAELELRYNLIIKEINTVVAEELRKVLRSAVNLYCAFMTLSHNYYIYSDDMYLCSIINFMPIFNKLPAVVHNENLRQIIFEETADTIEEVGSFVDLTLSDQDVHLRNHPDYCAAICFSGGYLSMLIESAAETFSIESISKINEPSEAEKFAELISMRYFLWLKIAQKYQEACLQYADRLEKALNTMTEKSPERLSAEMMRSEVLKGQIKLYRAVVKGISHVFRRLSGADFEIWRTILRNTVPMLTSFRTLLNYRCISTSALLSDQKDYEELWRNADVLLLNEVPARFAYFHDIRRKLLVRLAEISEGDLLQEDIKQLEEISYYFNGYFRSYYLSGYDSNNFKLILVNNYVKYLCSYIIAIQIISKTQRTT